MAKFFFYYDNADGVIKEGTLRLLNETIFTASATTGLSSPVTGLRHVDDVSTFIPVCVQYDDSKDAQDTIPEAYAFANGGAANRFQLHPGYYSGGSLSVLGTASNTLNAVTTLSPFDSFDSSSNHPCSYLQNGGNTTSMSVSWSLVYPALDLVNNDSNSHPPTTDGNGVYLPFAGEDAKVRLHLSATQALQTGWYAVELDTTSNSEFSVASFINTGIVFTTHIRRPHTSSSDR